MLRENVLPFYMIYPLPLTGQEEEAMIQDLEYMQQLYPADAKRYQKKIAALLDTIDYDGSLLYDEYPCRWQMYRRQGMWRCVTSAQEKPPCSDV